MAPATSTSGTVQTAATASQFLTFILDGEEYGVEILRVQSIHGWDRATPIPNTPDHILGVINLRGEIVPVVDLRRRFGMDAIPFGPTTVVIIVRIIDGAAARTVGLVVDAISDVYQLDGEVVQRPPEMGDGVNAEFVKGLATVGDKMIILLEIDRLISFAAVARTAEQASLN